MKEYKRLTKKGSYYDKDDHDLDLVLELDENHYEIVQDINVICKKLNRLAELEDKIENGTLIELPCKVGTTLYFIYNRPLADKPNLTPRIHETSNWYFDIDEKGIAISTRSPYGYNGEYFYYLGEMVFLTKAEAEKKLEELKNENTCKQQDKV